MKKIHGIGYGDFFGEQFDMSKIDPALEGLEDEEKLRIIDHIMDYLYVNF